MNALFEWPARRPVLTLLIALALVVASVLLIVRLRPETSLDAMLDPSDPATVAMTKVLQRFPVAEELLVLVSTSDDLPRDSPRNPQRQLAYARELEAALLKRAADNVRAVRYRPSAEARAFVEKQMAPAGLLYLNEAQLAAARQRLTPEAMAEQFRRNEAMLAAPGPAAGGLAKAILQDPLRLHELLQERLRELAPPNMGGDGFFSPDGRDLLIRIEGARPLSDLDFSTALTEQVTAIAQSIDHTSLRIRITGGYAIAAYNARMIRQDAMGDSISSVFVLALLFVVLYRRPGWTFIVAFTPIAVGIVCGFGLYALMRDTITPLAAVIGGALGGIGIDYSTHMLAHHRGKGSPAELARRMAWPLLAACVTSVIGFAVIGFSPVRLLRDFALVGSLALAGAFVAALTILPAMLSLRQTAAEPRVRVMRAPWRYPKAVLLASVLLLIPVAIVASGVDLKQQDPDLHNLHPQPNPPLEAQDELSRRMGLTGGSFLVYVTGSSAEELLERCHAVQQRFSTPAAREAGIRSVFGPASLLPAPSIVAARKEAFPPDQVQTVLASFDAAVAGSGFEAGAYAPYREVLPKLLRPPGAPGIDTLSQYPDLAATVLPRHSPDHDAVVHLFFDQPQTTRAQIDRSLRALHELLAGVPGATLTGMSAISQQTLTAVQRDLPRVALLAGGLVAAYLVVHYRSLTLALLAMVPTIVSLLLLLAVMRWTGISLNVVNLVMVPLLLGINIDFGIFAADTLRDPEEHSLAEQFTSSLQAITTCTVTAVIGFGSLAFTSVPAVRSLGILVIVGVSGCAIGAATVLWPIVLLIAKRRGMT